MSTIRKLLTSNSQTPFGYAYPIRVYFDQDETLQSLQSLAILGIVFVALVFVRRILGLLWQYKGFARIFRFPYLVLQTRVAKTAYSIHDILHWFIWIGAVAACFNPRDFPKQVGYIIVASMVLILLPVYRWNMWTKFTGIPFPDAVKYHRWLGRIIFVLCMIHMVGYWKQWSDQGVFPSEMFIKPKNTWGHISAIFIIVLVASSVYLVRRKLWDLFKIIHMLTFLGFFVAGLIHHPQALTYTVLPLFFYALDQLWSLFCTWKAGRIEFEVSSVAESGAVMLSTSEDLRLQRQTSFGQYYYVSIPTIHDRMAWHPLTAASAPNTKKLVFMVSGKQIGQWSDRINEAPDSGKRKLLLDGPYTSSFVNLRAYDTIVLIAGGIGITPILSALQDDAMGQVASVRLVWCIKKKNLKNYCSEIFDSLKEKKGIKMSIHLTTKPETDEEEMHDLAGRDGLSYGRPDWDKVLREVRQESKHPFNRVGVVVCGPRTLTHHVVDACNGCSDDKVIFEVFKETFKL